MPRIINLEVLDEIFEMSAPIVRALFRDELDIPVVARGSNDVPYEIDFDETLAWRVANQEKAAEAIEVRKAEPVQMCLDVYPIGRPTRSSTTPMPPPTPRARSWRASRRGRIIRKR